MIIEYGIQPNCSELVIYLNGWDPQDARDKMASNGIHEVIAKEFYGRHEEIIGDWDDTVEEHKTEVMRDISPTVLQLMDDRDSQDEKIVENAEKQLKELGFDLWNASVQLLADGSEPDWENGSQVSFRSEFENDGPAIVAHQHCQVQNFPLVRKLAEIFEEEVMGYDGGSDVDYNEWLDEKMKEEIS